jgi:HAE1 family hydrophobic/amphiphilic exporter-1
VNVSLVPVAERKKSQADLINQARQMVKKYSSKDWQVTVSASSSIAGSIGLGRGGSSVGMYIAGPDMDKLTEYANAMVEKMKQVPLYRDPDSSIDIGNPEIRVTIDRTKAADMGVRAGDVAQALNVLSAGQIVSTYSEGSQQYDVIVRAEEQFRRDRSNFKYFTVGSSNGGTVDLERVVKINEDTSPSSINRLNRQRQVTVSAGLPPNTS